jgi:molybdopterin-biosynthesis enzyme MoeA-like protein
MVDDVFCFPGFPEMLRPMFLWVLNEVLKKPANGPAVLVKEWHLPVSEGEIAEEIEVFALRYPEASVGLYPHIVKGSKQNVTVRLRYPQLRSDIPKELDRLITSMGWESLDHKKTQLSEV